jgi:hypothetical protein
MTTLTIKDLTVSKELDGKAMAAVAGGSMEYAQSAHSPMLMGLFGLSMARTDFPVGNCAANESLQANGAGPFNFGMTTQSNDSYQGVTQAGNTLIG